MDGILALGHFCESHGPCVVLSTQRYKEVPEQTPHSLTVPWCEACQSLQLDQALVSRDNNFSYVTTRTPLQQDLAFLLKQATVRSLSCEQEGTLYFGDNERGHVISHTFTVHDSLARGFQRKYTLLMLMRDKIDLLNLWPLLLKHMKEIGGQLCEYSAELNEREQAQRSQRAVRQAQISPGSAGRSLSQLTGKPAIYAHIHLWFVWLLGCQIAVEEPCKVSMLPTPKPTIFLKVLYQDMGNVIFREVCSLFLMGIPLKTKDVGVITALQSLFPEEGWISNMDPSRYCDLYRDSEGKWIVESDVDVPIQISGLQKSVEQSLCDPRLTEGALEPQLAALVAQWFHIARVLSWCPQADLKLLQSLGVKKCDIDLLIFWTSHCVDSEEKHKNIVKNLNTMFK